MKYAIAKIGGKQLKITEGLTFRIEHQDKLNFDVLAYSDGKETLIGTPILSNIIIKASILGQERGRKVRVARFKAKSRYDKVNGHRQPLSIVKVDTISLKAETAKKAEKKAKEE
jgi:large subunit ribosomal protein L21